MIVPFARSPVSAHLVNDVSSVNAKFTTFFIITAGAFGVLSVRFVTTSQSGIPAQVRPPVPIVVQTPLPMHLDTKQRAASIYDQFKFVKNGNLSTRAHLMRLYSAQCWSGGQASTAVWSSGNCAGVVKELLCAAPGDESNSDFE